VAKETDKDAHDSRCKLQNLIRCAAGEEIVGECNEIGGNGLLAVRPELRKLGAQFVVANDKAAVLGCRIRERTRHVDAGCDRIRLRIENRSDMLLSSVNIALARRRPKRDKRLTPFFGHQLWSSVMGD
jgi:hypothetical protein